MDAPGHNRRCQTASAFFVAVLAAFYAAAASGARAATTTDYVDPFIGTDGTGHVFPGAVVPFGMVAPSPDNADRGWSYAGGYQYRAPAILGFSNTHINGAGIPELGDVLLQPRSGAGWTATTTDFSSDYDKAQERARPGYYAVRLRKNAVLVELTATQRVAAQRYSFDTGRAAQVLVDLQHGLLFAGEGATASRVLSAQTHVDTTRSEITGTIVSKNWVERQASFVVAFDRPIASVVTLPARDGDRAPRYMLTFDLGRDRRLEARVALSTVDEAGARDNLKEAEGKSFAMIRADADRLWRSYLDRIRIDASVREKHIFYSALYRTLIHPSDISDRDGQVRGPRGVVINARGGAYYSTLSLWDTFRAVHPLLTLVAPEKVDGFIATFLDHHKQQGYLPLWTAWGRETFTMIGNPALPVIADAVAKRFSGFDRAEALAAMVETSTAARPDAPAWAQRDWAVYETYGYLPFDLEPGESVSRALEYGIGDAAIAATAVALDDRDVAARFAKRARGYRLLFDPSTQTMRGKDSKGRWRTPFDPFAATSPMKNPGDYTEANAFQYTTTPALHDAAGFAALLGGKKPLGDWLDRFFAAEGPGVNKHLGQEALIGQYAHGNEPSHHIAWLYLWSDRPETAASRVDEIASRFYADAPDGIIGNDDCGQMSAWYVFATLGFYPVEPMKPRYALAAPRVSRAVLHVPGRPRLAIKRAPPGASPTLDGAPIGAGLVGHADLAAGGELAFGGRILSAE